MTILQTTKNTHIKDFSYFGTGGISSDLILPQSIEDLASYLKKAKPLNIQLLGKGSNSLVGDDPYEGLFILFKDLHSLSLDGTRLIVGAGVENTAIAEFAFTHQLEGAEWMHFLPGQIGATTRMNARCYGGEISQIVSEVTTLSYDGSLRKYSDPGIFRGYKDTIFMGRQEMIVEVCLSLNTMKNPRSSKSRMDFCRTDRENKGQFNAPSCGCVFKNNYDIGVPSGMLLEAADVKGLRLGGARVSEQHANFILNDKDATAREILELSFLMRDKVFKEFGVWLEYEMELLGAFTQDLRRHYLLMIESKPNHSKLAPLLTRFKSKNLT